MVVLSKKALADKLIEIISQQVARIPDDRPNQRVGKITLHDVIMSGFAVMHLKYPSLLDYDQERLSKEVLHNLNTLYHIDTPPCDSYLRDVLDPLATVHLRKLFTCLFSFVQRSGRLKQFSFLEEGYLAPIDGTGHFSSGSIHCNECCCKNANTAKPAYYHQLLAICLVKPGKKEVLPLMPEPIIQQVDASKNDCEKTALKRLLANVAREHPKLKLVVTADGLYSDGPTIKLLKSYGHGFILVAKDGDHASLLDAVDVRDAKEQVDRFEYQDEKGFKHWFRYVNDVPINKSHPDVMVNYLEYVETSPKGKKFTCIWVTNIHLTPRSVTKVMRGGRSRWKIENETFNTLKTQGYHLEHNYGHGQEHLATNLSCLMFLAFLVDQIEQLCCPVFQNAWRHSKSKISLWRKIRSLFDWFRIDSWNDLLLAIFHRSGKVPNIRSLIPDTS